MPRNLNITGNPAKLRRRAEARLGGNGKSPPSRARDPRREPGPRQLLHELQVHQIELEMQNTELQEARNRIEAMLEKYTDLYDFAPVGYFSMDEQSRILEVNLTGAALLGVERSRLINRLLVHFVVPATQPVFLAFLERVCAGTGKQVCEASLVKKDAATVWASLHGIPAVSTGGPRRWCRVAVSDITPLKQAEEAERRLEAMVVANQELKHLSRQVLRAQEEERKRISRELHDVIAQTLTGINVRLANLRKEAAFNTKGLEGHIARTQSWWSSR